MRLLALLALPAALGAACALAGRPDAPATPSAPAARPASQVSAAPPALAPAEPPGDAAAESELRGLVTRYYIDRYTLLRRHDAAHSPDRRQALERFLAAWRERLDGLAFDALGLEGRIDAVLLGGELDYERELARREEQLLAETAPLLPFAGTILELHDAQRRLEFPDPEASAGALDRLATEVERTKEAVARGAKGGGEGAIATTRIVALRAANLLGGLRSTLGEWHGFRAGYDPLFTWWTGAPYRRADAALDAYAKVLRADVVGIHEGEDEPIVGDPVGRDALLVELAHELIPYAPEELVANGEREFAWCEAEMKRAAQDMGLGEDWKAALERVKQDHVAPGQQPELVRDLAREAIAFVEERGLLTVPELAKDDWRMEMLSAEDQKTNPFFLGGESIQVAFPTDAMEHADKLMSLRGNNVHFARATVHHELVPGHHLQGFMNERYNAHRNLFSTPFWTEGWAVYWEMLLWDLGFPRSPEDRVGMLFWRMHRCARIVFSLSFHLGTMTPEQCIDFLVERVGHERANATAEVRRSFNGNYSPLYQVGYMLGALQFRALRHELVDSGRMRDREFHDGVLQ